MRAHQFALGPFDPVAYFHSLKRREECFVRADASAIACGIALPPGCDASGWSQRTSLATGTHDTASSTQNDSSLCRFVFLPIDCIGCSLCRQDKTLDVVPLSRRSLRFQKLFPYACSVVLAPATHDLLSLPVPVPLPRCTLHRRKVR